MTLNSPSAAAEIVNAEACRGSGSWAGWG